MSNIVLFEDIFVVEKIDPDGKKFDKGMISDPRCRFNARFHCLLRTWAKNLGFVLT